MTSKQPFPPGQVDWAGENPGMYLKESETGPFTGLVSFFRVVLSPQGRGHALVLIEAPERAESDADRLNVCVTDNQPMARYLVENFVSAFGAFRGCAGLKGLVYRKLETVTTAGDHRSTYLETVIGDGVEARLSWGGLGEPFMVDMPAASSATGKHQMFSLFVESRDAVATVNGRRLRGRSQPRDFAGRPSTTAFLAFAETWVKAPA